MISTLAEAKKHAHTLGNASKMPGFTYGIPAWLCNVGAKLREIKGSTCEECYALKGRYKFTNVEEAEQKRFDTLEDPLWVDAMVFQIKHHCTDKRGK